MQTAETEITQEAGTGEIAEGGPDSPMAKALAIMEAADTEEGNDGAVEQSPATPQPAKTEEPAEPAPAAEPKPDPDAFWKQKTEQYRRDYSKLDEERKQFKDELTEYRQWKAAKGEAKYNPNKALDLIGVSQEEFTKLLLSEGGEMSPAMRLALEAKQRAEAQDKELKTLQQQLQEREEQQKLAEYRSQVQTYLSGSGEEHEFLTALGEDMATHLVMGEINNHYAANVDPATNEGPVLTFREAADRIEKRMEADMYEKYMKTKKLRSRFEQEYKVQKQPARNGPRTITGSMTPSTSTQPTTEEERYQHALKVLTAGWQ